MNFTYFGFGLNFVLRRRSRNMVLLASRLDVSENSGIFYYLTSGVCVFALCVLVAVAVFSRLLIFMRLLVPLVFSLSICLSCRRKIHMDTPSCKCGLRWMARGIPEKSGYNDRVQRNICKCTRWKYFSLCIISKAFSDIKCIPSSFGSLHLFGQHRTFTVTHNSHKTFSIIEFPLVIATSTCST